ncbi:hypothetical protein CJ430_02275 [Klebsiella pneumoniae]|nr:hypothetical protein CJ430_02275 [Klebsiella pneumoniae]
MPKAQGCRFTLHLLATSVRAVGFYSAAYLAGLRPVASLPARCSAKDFVYILMKGGTTLYGGLRLRMAFASSCAAQRT